MKLIKLDDGCYVASDTVAELKANFSANCVTVRTKDGIGHSVFPQYREGVHGCLDRLAAEINAAEAQARPSVLMDGAAT